MARKRRKRAPWAEWAYPLAAELRELWTWLKGQPLPMIAASLGRCLGPRWDAGDVVDFLTQARDGRELPAEIHSPAGFLRDLIEDALTGRLQPPYPARLHSEHQARLARQRRDAAVAEAEQRRLTAEATRAEHALRDAAAAADRAGPGTGRVAALAAARAAAARLTAERQDRQARQAEIYRGAAGSGATLADSSAETWPQVAEPGAGLPRTESGYQR